MLNQEDKYRLENYLRGAASKDDNTWVQDLFANGQDHTELQHYVGRDWDSFQHTDIVEKMNYAHTLDRVHHEIRKKEYQKKKSLIRRMTSTYTKIAAILLIPLLIAGSLTLGYLWNNADILNNEIAQTTIFAPIGSRVSFQLPDGTSGWLNGGANLVYSIPFGDKRQISLEGEGWFDVAHDEDRPFEITAGESVVRVLGTSFNMIAYPMDNHVEVVLLEGSIQFLNNNKPNSEGILLSPSDRLLFEKDKQSVVISKVDPENYKMWTEGKLVFEGESMLMVARKIERWYNIEVEIPESELNQYSINATFVNDTFEDVLQYISMISPIEYEITPSTQLTNGTFQKTKVTISKR